MRDAALVALVAAAWAALRLTMNREYEGATFDALVELRAPSPFGQRVLVPWLCRPFVDAGVPVGHAFAISEWLATIALLVATGRALAHDVSPRAAIVGRYALLGALAFPMLLAHRWNVFYPWDTWAMAALVLAVDGLRQGRMVLVLAVVFVGGLNRESIALVPLLAVALHLERPTLRTSVAWAVWFGFAYLGARWLAAAIVAPRGPALHVWLGDELRLVNNLRWLGTGGNALVWLGSVAAVPLVWWASRRFAPRDLARLHLPALVGLAGLLAVANAYEPRVYGELLALVWLPCFVGGWRWALGEREIERAPGWVGVVDRVAGGGLLVVAVIVVVVVVYAAPARPR